ncbi:alpha-mannosidase [Pedobacter sp. W3I1]|uniref:glycoside hydrolase family 38 C-terminal domain-containing protein n=1 Tax=Pedobacter sp. W3I1 TaxID=3042291 RepID=UPI002788B9FF|nr:glycoside hydrolase family 38 C-terminal domain-containing protein [Pedobacter sp. W3I1]MDQ0638896.1 alpha-mannosidase [Pedobacter sp. W3I1]
MMLTLLMLHADAQNKFFIDGYHGGFWGHYPVGYTGFIADKLEENSFWKINLEIEPVTWDVVQKNDLTNYNRFKTFVKDQSVKGRVEFVNPSYGQSYLFNIQGESVIRQFEIGIKTIKAHFPEAEFYTYSSEEPCFTSALPQILKSFGYRYASLKNPNTCWGGYTRAFGGELIKWKGSDGSVLLTVPRYETEALLQNSTWQTQAWNNSEAYISAAYRYGIQNPIGMCLQDAGWENGPWLGKPKDFTYKTWRDYMENTADKTDLKTWNFNQEDVQVSLVWGAQVLQKIAQNTRIAENKITIAEKIDAINAVANKSKLIGGKFDAAWQNLLLAQHHDSWIVPYNIVNKEKRWSWADAVTYWTDQSNHLCDSILNIADKNASENPNGFNVRVYNSQAYARKEIAKIQLDQRLTNPIVIGQDHKKVNTQLITENGNRFLLFEALAPALGDVHYSIKPSKTKIAKPITHISVKGNLYTFNNEDYEIAFNAAKGGIIESLIAKKLCNKQFVDQKSKRSFNEMRGYFYQDSTFYSSKDQVAKITVVEDGLLMTRLKIEGKISNHAFTQYITLKKYDSRIDVQTTVNWQNNAGIGQDYAQKSGWKANDLKKAFYNDSLKLQAVFPLNIAAQKVYKNAAFDVMESRLKNTYFNTWDSIKNNVLVNWVDVSDHDDHYGMALLNDHTTSYAHNETGILGLTLQYSGVGLWGRNYDIKGASQYHYALFPHRNKWDKAEVWSQSITWNEPLQVVTNNKEQKPSFSLLQIAEPGYEISSLTMEDGALLFRVFNANAVSNNLNLNFNIPIKKAELVELNHTKSQTLKLLKKQNGITAVNLPIPQFGLRTIKIYLQ